MTSSSSQPSSSETFGTPTSPPTSPVSEDIESPVNDDSAEPQHSTGEMRYERKKRKRLQKRKNRISRKLVGTEVWQDHIGIDGNGNSKKEKKFTERIFMFTDT